MSKRTFPVSVIALQALLSVLPARYCLAESNVEETSAGLRVESKSRQTVSLDEPLRGLLIPPMEIHELFEEVLGPLTGFEFVFEDPVGGKMGIGVEDMTLRQILDYTMRQKGVAWKRNGRFIFICVPKKYRTRVFPLTSEKFRVLAQRMEPSFSPSPADPRPVAFVFGEGTGSHVPPGCEFRLNAKTETLIVTGTQWQTRKAEVYVKDLSASDGSSSPLIFRSYALEPEIAPDIVKLVRRFLVEEVGGGPEEFEAQGKKILFDEEKSVLVLRDTRENLETVENVILRRESSSWTPRYRGLCARVFQISHDKGMDSETVARRREAIRQAVKELKRLLYTDSGETEEEVKAEGRRIFYPQDDWSEIKDPRLIGSITIVDTEENLKKVEEYLAKRFPSAK